MPTSAASSKAKPPRKGKAKPSDSATPVEPKPKRKGGGGRKPGAKAWTVAELLRFFWLIAQLCPNISRDWIELAEQHSAEQETDRTEKACTDKWGAILKVRKPTGGRNPHPLYTLAHVVNAHVNKVHGTVTLNDNPARLAAELKESIADAFDVAKALLKGFEDTTPAFDKDFEPLEQPDEEVDEEGEEVEAAEDDEEREEDHEDGVELYPEAEYQGEDVEEFGPGEAPDGVEIHEAVYQPPTPEPAPVARESPIWDAEKDGEPPAEPPALAAPARARPKMVSPNKAQPALFEHFVPASSTARASAGPSMSSKAPNPSTPLTPARFPLSKTEGTGPAKSGTGSGAATKVKSDGNAVASGSKLGTSTKVAQNPGGKNSEDQLEYVVPKHQAGGKPATKGTKRGSNPSKTNEPPAKKSKGKEREEVLEISSSDETPARREDEFIDRFIEKKEASNAATVVAMDSKRELHLVREQLATAQKTIEELRETIRDYEVEKRVQERLQALGAAAPTAAMTELQFRDLLARYLQDNNLAIVDNWEAPSFPDPPHPFDT